MTQRGAILLASLLAAAALAVVVHRQTASAPLPPWAPPPREADIPRPWRWATEAEWVVHDVVRHMASWSDPRDLPQIKVKVRDHAAGIFDVDITSRAGSRRLEVRRREHVWNPMTYVEVARALTPREPTPGPEPVLSGWADLLLEAGPSSLRRADAQLLLALQARPADATLHEKAALLWAAEALQTAVRELALLNGSVAHLALAAASRGDDSAVGDEGILAGVAIDTLLDRQVEAMASLERLDANTPDPFVRSWVNALRLRVTHDPRLIPATRPSRLEQIESIAALSQSLSCRAGVDRARAWRLAESVSWVTAALGSSHCPEPTRIELTDTLPDLQIAEATVFHGGMKGDLAGLVTAIEATSTSNPHQPKAPTDVVPAFVRADAAALGLVRAFQYRVDQMNRLAQRDAIKIFDVATAQVQRDLTAGAWLTVTLERLQRERSTRGLSRPTCDRLARIVADRPDLLTSWDVLTNCPVGSMGLLKMVPAHRLTVTTFVPGTGRIGRGPWQEGLPLEEEHLSELARRAPWSRYLAWYLPPVRNRLTEVTAEMARESHAKLLDYDINAMEYVSTLIVDDDDELQRLNEKMCGLYVEHCAHGAERLYYVGRDDAAERMWKRAVQSAEDRIALSNNLQRYVGLLLDRGDTTEALRLARVAAEVYSGGGLRTLGYAYERLGRFEEAAAQYAKITRRYGDPGTENAFYVRYRHRHGRDRFDQKSQLAFAEMFPRGLVKMTREDAEKRGLMGVFQHGLTPADHRVGLRERDQLVALDGYLVENEEQANLVWSLADGPAVTMVVRRQPHRGKPSWIELTGRRRRIGFGPVPRPPASVPSN
jgi:tetratricopeptide (TPR) repeat protein